MKFTTDVCQNIREEKERIDSPGRRDPYPDAYISAMESQRVSGFQYRALPSSKFSLAINELRDEGYH
jgi:hypothetical protein